MDVRDYTIRILEAFAEQKLSAEDLVSICEEGNVDLSLVEACLDELTPHDGSMDYESDLEGDFNSDVSNIGITKENLKDFLKPYMFYYTNAVEKAAELKTTKNDVDATIGRLYKAQLALKK